MSLVQEGQACQAQRSEITSKRRLACIPDAGRQCEVSDCCLCEIGKAFGSLGCYFGWQNLPCLGNGARMILPVPVARLQQKTLSVLRNLQKVGSVAVGVARGASAHRQG